MSLRLSKSPLDNPISGIQIVGWLLYIVFVCVSIWATGESISRSFKLPLPIGYLIGGVISSACGAFLYIIKSALQEKNSSKIILTTIAFLVLWTLSLLTNTHQFYLVGVWDNLRLKEMKDSENVISNVEGATESYLRIAQDSFLQKASGLAAKVRDEIIDEGKPGLGRRAKTHIAEAENYLGVPIAELQATGSSKSEILDLGKRQYAVINERIDEIVNDKFRNPQNELSAYFQQVSQEGQDNISTLQDAIKSYGIDESNEVDNVLRNSHGFYNKVYDFVSDRVKSIAKYGGTNFERKLPELVESIELENIANSFNYVMRNKAYNQSRFLLAFAIAFAIDLAGFIIFYFMALPSPKRYN